VALGVRRGDEDVQLTLRLGEMPVATAPTVSTAPLQADQSLPKAVGSVNVPGNNIPLLGNPDLPLPPVQRSK